MEKIRHLYGQNCKKVQKLKTFKTIFNGFLKIFCIKIILFQKVMIHLNSTKTIQYICKWHIKNIIYGNFISKIKTKSQNITNIYY